MLQQSTMLANLHAGDVCVGFYDTQSAFKYRNNSCDSRSFEPLDLLPTKSHSKFNHMPPTSNCVSCVYMFNAATV